MVRDPLTLRTPWAFPGLMCLVVMLSLSAGCSGVKTRDPVIRNVFRDHREVREARSVPSGEWGAVLRREGLLELAEADPGTAAAQLENRLKAKPNPDAADALALAELSYRAGLNREDRHPHEAIAWFRDAAALASLAIQNAPGGEIREPIKIHNRSVAHLVRISQEEGKRHEGGWQGVLQDRGLSFESVTPDLAPSRFADLKPVEDLEVDGMQHLYKVDGFGVSLVAHREVQADASPDPLDRFHPHEVRLAATAVVTPVGGLEDMAWRSHPTTLALLDPFIDQSVMIGHHSIALAGDRTTPLALQATEGSVPALEMTGLFDSDFKRPGVSAGLYFIRRYEPGKIPIVFVHGLFSSPRSFLQNLNELQNDPDIASKFQFWVFLYPTGQPIPNSAMQLRTSLNKVRDTLDPDHAEPTLDQLVLVGHSMGGLLSKMMVQRTGLTLWNAAFNRSPEELRASPEIRKSLDEAMIFEPLPFVRRVIFIATPHRGSPIADQWFGRTIAAMIRRTDEQTMVSRELVELNGPNLIAPELRRMPLNAIGNLRTDSPLLRALDEIPISRDVPYHSIIPQIAGRLPSDGVVPYRSSHLDGAASEKIVPGTHSAQQNPDVTEELKRILRLHLDGG